MGVVPFIPNAHPTLDGVALDGVTPKVDVLAYITGGYSVNNYGLLVGPNVHTRLIPEAHTQPTITPRNIIDHSNAGSTPSRWENLLKWINRPEVNGEPHLQFDMDGQVAQFVPFHVRADCNAKANQWYHHGVRYGAISHETADRGAQELPRTPWSIPQFDALVAAHTVECATYRIRCTATTAWDDSGIGYHSQFPEWSIYKGKTCPGAARIRQMDELRNRVAGNLARYYELTGGGCP
jgi:hypothetical protein